MDLVPQVFAGIAAVVLILVFPVEAFWIRRPWAQRFLGIEPEGIDHVHLWSFCIGARNALAGVGALIGLTMVNTGQESTGSTVVVVALAYMLLSSLAMGLADLLGFWLPRGGSVRGTVASSLLPALALITMAT